jgi:uroporphyrinogen-III synthase
MSETAITFDKERLTKVSSILVSQPEPTDKNSPYLELAKKYDIKIDFRPFIQVEPITVKEFRKQKINILDHTAIVFTSKKAVEHFFDLCKGLRIEMPVTMKYFCVTEQTANFLQKFIVIRKRKIFNGTRTVNDLFPYFKKHKDDKYLFPCSHIRKDDTITFMRESHIKVTEMVLYKTVSSNLSDLVELNYDVLAFFSPSGVISLKENFPTFEQNGTRIAAFGPTTSKAVRDAGLILDIEAPLPNAPSMTGALEAYIKLANQPK